MTLQYGWSILRDAATGQRPVPSHWHAFTWLHNRWLQQSSSLWQRPQRYRHGFLLALELWWCDVSEFFGKTLNLVSNLSSRMSSRDVASKRSCSIWPLSSRASREFTELWTSLVLPNIAAWFVGSRPFQDRHAWTRNCCLPSRDVASKRVCFIWPLSSREFTELPSRDVASKRSFCIWPLSSREFTGLPSRDVASKRSCFIRPFSSREFTEPHAIANLRRKYKRIFFNSHAVTSQRINGVSLDELISNYQIREKFEFQERLEN